MLRSIPRASALKSSTALFKPATLHVRMSSSDSAVEKAQGAYKAAQEQTKDMAKKTSALSSEGSIGKHFDPAGSIGQVGEKIGGPFSKDGAVGSQFDAGGNGVAGQIEKKVDGPKAATTTTKGSER